MAWKTPTRPNPDRTAPGGWPDPNNWFTPGRFAVLLGVLILAGWPQVLLGWESFYYVDYATFGYPLAFHHRAAFWNGEVPLWNPLNNCGTPFLAQWNTLTLYPLSLIYLCLPLPWSLALFCLAHLYLAGLGMYFLAWRWSGNRLAAAAAGAVFAFNGLSWFALMWPNNIAALGWMPWVVLAVETAWSKGRAWIPLAGAIAALQVLAGAPEVAFLTWLFLAALWVLLLFRREIPRVQLTSRALGLGLLLTGLTAAQMLPFLDLLAHSQRNTSYGDPRLMAMPLWGWANYVLPLFRMVERQGIYLQPNQVWTASYYVGIATVALAALALRQRAPRVWLLAALSLFSLFMALGAPGKVYTWVGLAVPQMNFMRFPIKFVVLATFCLPLLAAFGLAACSNAQPQTGSPPNRRPLLLTAAAFAALILALAIIAHLFPFPGELSTTTTLNALLRLLFLASFIGLLLQLRRETHANLQKLWQAALILLLWLDVYSHSSNLSPTVPSRVLAPNLIRQFFGWENQLHHGQSRALQGRASFWRLLADSSPDPEVDVHGRRLALFFNLNLLDAVPKFDGFFSLEIREYSDLFRQIYFGVKEAAPLKQFLGIAYMSNPTNSVDWLKSPGALPLLTAGQQPEFVSSQRALELILDDAFHPLKTVYLSPESQPTLTAQPTSQASISGARFSPHRISATISTPVPTLVVAAQVHYHPWRAFIDGQPAPIHRANYAFQAIAVPAGSHQLELRYLDRAFATGLAASCAAVLLSAGLALFHTRARIATFLEKRRAQAG